jgi:hypothetical protein
MEIKKYDRFSNDYEVIEYTGLFQRFGIETRPVFKVIEPAPGDRSDEIRVFTERLLKDAGLKKIPPPALHPLVKEVGGEVKNNPKLFRQLIQYFAVAYEIATNEDRQEMIQVLRERLTEKVKKEIRPGELCEQCCVCYGAAC